MNPIGPQTGASLYCVESARSTSIQQFSDQILDFVIFDQTQGQKYLIFLMI